MDYRLEQLRFELREDPSSRIFFKLGEVLRREGELDEAIEVLSTGLDLHPRYVAAWVSYGRALLGRGSSREATDALRRALDLDPENAVACRVAGDAAIANGEWVEAIKNLKRARAMSAPDDGLDERIGFVEGKLAERGQLESPGTAETPPDTTSAPPPEPPDDDQPFAVDQTGPGGPSGADDVFDSGSDNSVLPAEDNGRATMAIPVAEMSIPSSPDEAFPTGPPQYPASMFDSETDSEIHPVFDLDADALIADEDGDERESEVEFTFDTESESDSDPDDLEPDSTPAVEPEPVFDIEVDVDMIVEDRDVDVADAVIEPATVPVSVADIEVGQHAEPVFEIDADAADAAEAIIQPEPEEEPHIDMQPEELPLPTMTLARLALDQGDLDLAEKTLRGVIVRDPNHPEAAELLAGLSEGAPEPKTSTADATSDVRAQALRRWLKAVRLASERLKA